MKVRSSSPGSNGIVQSSGNRCECCNGLSFAHGYAPRTAVCELECIIREIFTDHGQTINDEHYCATLQRFLQANKNMCRGAYLEE